MMVTMKALAEKVGFSLSYVKKLKSRGEFIEDYHYYKKNGKIYFDESAFYDWVKSKDMDGEYIQPKRQDLDKLVSKWKAGAKVN